MAASAGTVTLDLDANSVRLLRGLQKSDRATKRTASNMRRNMTNAFAAIRTAAITASTALVGAGAIVSRQQLQMAGNLQRVSETVGFTTESVQELRFAAEQLNLSQRTVDLGLQRFSRRLGEAAKGGGELLKIVEQYNVELLDSNGQLKSNSQLLRIFADIISKTKDEQEQLRIAFKLFDSEGAGLVRLLRQGGAGLDDFAAKARAAGIVLDDELIAKAAETDRVFNEIKQTIDAKLAKAVAENADSLERLGEVIATLKTEAIEAIGPVTDFIDGVKTGVEGLAEFVGRIVNGEEFDPIVDITERLSEARKKLKSLRDTQSGLSERFRSPDFESGISKDIAAQEALVNKLFEDRNRLVTELATKHKVQVAANLENAAAAREAAQATLDAAKAQSMVVESAGELEEIDMIKLWFDARRALKEYKKELSDAEKEQRRLRDQAEELGFTFSSAFEDAIVNGNKLRDVLAGLLKDILRIFVRKTITEPFGAALAGIFSPKGKALGGPVSAGVPHIVGERGRELFVPNESGTIIPNHALSKSGITINNNINVDGGVDPVQTQQMVRIAAEQGSELAIDKIRRLQTINEF